LVVKEPPPEDTLCLWSGKNHAAIQFISTPKDNKVMRKFLFSLIEEKGSVLRTAQLAPTGRTAHHHAQSSIICGDCGWKYPSDMI
jgi:hypothetical protein